MEQDLRKGQAALVIGWQARVRLHPRHPTVLPGTPEMPWICTPGLGLEYAQSQH